MKKITSLFILSICLISFMPFFSASCLNEILDESSSRIVATIGSNQTKIEVYLDTQGTSCDEVDISIGGFEMGGISISSILGNISFRADYRENEDIISFSNTSITGLAQSQFNNLFNFLDENITVDQINADNSVLINFVKKYTSNMPEMFGNAYLEKIGNDYTLFYDQGFDDLQESWMNNVTSAINEKKIYHLNINDYIDTTFGWEIPNLNDGGDLEIDVMVGNLFILNNTIPQGIYSIPVNFTFNGGTPITKIATLILTGNVSVDEIEEVLEEGEQIADEENVTIEENTTTLIFDTSSTVVKKIVIPQTVESNKTISLDMSSLLTLSGRVNVTVPNEIVLERDTSDIDYKVTIPANTTINGTSWDGILDLPTVTTVTTSLGTVETAVEIGDSAIKLEFNQAVKIVLIGMTGKRALWANSAGSYDISSCDSTANSTDEGTLTSGECYLDDGSDLIIWTYHFTKFGAYTPDDDIRRRSKWPSNESLELEIFGDDSSLNSESSAGSFPELAFLNKNDDQNPFGITGGVIGALTNPLFWIFINITVLLSIILVILSKKRKRDEKKIQEKVKQELEKKDGAKKEENLDIFFKEEEFKPEIKDKSTSKKKKLNSKNKSKKK